LAKANGNEEILYHVVCVNSLPSHLWNGLKEQINWL